MYSKILFMVLSLVSIQFIDAQNPYSAIEGRLEVYSVDDSTSLFIGINAGANQDLSEERTNTVIGYKAGQSNTLGSENLFIGGLAGSSNSIGNSNTFVGERAGTANTEGNGNSFFGYRAGAGNSISHNNSFFGYRTAIRDFEGSSNSFFGHEAGREFQSGSGNVFIGKEAGGNTQDVDRNIIIGMQSGGSIRNGFGNIVIGTFAGPSTNESEISERLYINHGISDLPLIYGEFDNDILAVNGQLRVNGAIDDKSQLLMEGMGGIFNEVIRYNNTNNDVIIGGISSLGGAYYIRTNALTRVSVTPNGNVGIGTDIPSEKLDINGAVNISSFMTLQPLDSKPFECATDKNGSVYYDSQDKTLRVCIGTTWKNVSMD